MIPFDPQTKLFCRGYYKNVPRTYFQNGWAKLLMLCKHVGQVSCPSSGRSLDSVRPRKRAHGKHFVRAAESLVGNEIWSGRVLSAAARCVLFGAVRVCGLSALEAVLESSPLYWDTNLLLFSFTLQLPVLFYFWFLHLCPWNFFFLNRNYMEENELLSQHN